MIESKESRNVDRNAVASFLAKKRQIESLEKKKQKESRETLLKLRMEARGGKITKKIADAFRLEYDPKTRTSLPSKSSKDNKSTADIASTSSIASSVNRGSNSQYHSKDSHGKPRLREEIGRPRSMEGNGKPQPVPAIGRPRPAEANGKPRTAEVRRTKDKNHKAAPSGNPMDFKQLLSLASNLKDKPVDYSDPKTLVKLPIGKKPLIPEPTTKHLYEERQREIRSKGKKNDSKIDSRTPSATKSDSKTPSATKIDSRTPSATKSDSKTSSATKMTKPSASAAPLNVPKAKTGIVSANAKVKTPTAVASSNVGVTNNVKKNEANLPPWHRVDKGNNSGLSRADDRRRFPPPPYQNRYQGNFSRNNSQMQPGIRRQFDYEEYDSEEESDLEDFIDDTPIIENEDVSYRDYSKHIKEIFKYDRSKYANEPSFDDRRMESRYTDILKEEAYSARVGMKEDLEDYKREQAALKKRRIEK